jgi:hypothetical protein
MNEFIFDTKFDLVDEVIILDETEFASNSSIVVHAHLTINLLSCKKARFMSTKSQL